MNMGSNWRAYIVARRLQIFVHDLGATGVVRNAIAVANEAAACGYQVRLLVCSAEGVLKRLVSPSVAIVELAGRGDDHRSRQAQMKAALFAYRKHSREWAPDIMMSAGNHGHLLSSFAWLGLPGIKLLRFSNDLAHGAPSGMTRLWRRAKFRLMAKLADRLVYVSRAQAGHPLLAQQLASGKALVIPNGVDVEHVRTAASEPCDHPWVRDHSVPLVLAVGRHVAQKNFPALLAAFALARSSRPMQLLFIGDGADQEIQRMRRMAIKLGVDRDVAFLPPVANPFPYLAAASTFVLPSRWEGSANVLLEAMACGTPVIAATTAGDAQHVLDHGRYGLLVEQNAIQQLADAILKQTGPDAVRPGERAAEFDRRISMHRYVQLFDMLLEQRAGHPAVRWRDRFKPGPARPSSRSAAAAARRHSFPA